MDYFIKTYLTLNPLPEARWGLLIILFTSVWFISWLLCCHIADSWREGAMRTLKGIYKMFILDRSSLAGIDIVFSGLILSILARAFWYWPTVASAIFLVSAWIFSIGVIVYAYEIARDTIKHRRVRRRQS